jgi:hypothetical protein
MERFVLTDAQWAKMQPQRGTQKQAIGRSKGGMTTKIRSSS